MKILLVYPQYPDTFWRFKYALKFISKKAAFPPLGLLTVAAMLPKSWEKKLIDMNVRPLKDIDIKWADLVFISSMSIQKRSTEEVISRCKKLDVKVVAGGPLFTTEYNEFDEVDYLVLNEAELTLPPFLEDLKKGSPKHLYTTNQWADMSQTPVPLWELVNIKDYASMNIQFSRGCPFNCEFCDIVFLYGRIPRIKSKGQIIAELEKLYSLGWRGGVFFVDDNFIGDKKRLKKDILPAIIEWMRSKKYPFTFNTETSINLADDEELMDKMVEAGFDSVFVGIETPNDDSLAECGKFQNRGRDLIASIKKIQRFGLQVQGGFIVGFVCAIMGVGGGFLAFPLHVYVLGVSSFTTVGTNIFQIIFTAGYASITQYAIFGFVFYTLAMGLLLGSLAGIQIGALVTKVVRGFTIRGLYAIAILAGFLNSPGIILSLYMT